MISELRSNTAFIAVNVEHGDAVCYGNSLDECRVNLDIWCGSSPLKVFNFASYDIPSDGFSGYNLIQKLQYNSKDTIIDECFIIYETWKKKKSVNDILIYLYNIAWDIEMAPKDMQKLFEAAISCGRSDALCGDEISSVDLKTEERILEDIYLTAKFIK